MSGAEGYLVMPGPYAQPALARVVATYDRLVAQAPPANLHSGSTSVRVTGLLEQNTELAAIFCHKGLLDFAASVIGGPFRLSAFHGRNVRPNAAAQRLHRDVARGTKDWPLVGFIFMVDDFHATNGATRFVPGSQGLTDMAPGFSDGHPDERLATGAAGSIIAFDGSLWHGHGANASGQWRRSIQGAFIPLAGTPAADLRGQLTQDAFSALPPIARRLIQPY